MKTVKLLLAVVVSMMVAKAAVAQDQPAVGTKASLGIGAVRATPALVEAEHKAGSSNQLDRVAEAMDAQLMDALHNTRKFTLVARSDLKEILGEQKLVASGNVDSDDVQAAQAFKLAGCKYLLVTTIDNFQDYVETAHFAGYNESATRRIVQYSCVAKIYDTTTAKLLESANFQLNNSEVERNPAYVQAKGDLKEELYTAMARMMSQRISDRVIDVLYPAKIIARTDNIVTINRGDGTNVAIGQVWEAFALGEELKDPDTGASLGREEVKVGSVRITSVQPLFSKAEVQNDHGVDKGQILRLVGPPAGAAPAGGPMGGPAGGPPPPPPQQ